MNKLSLFLLFLYMQLAASFLTSNEFLRVSKVKQVQHILVSNLQALTPLQQDLSAATLSVGGTIVWLQLIIGLANQGKIDAKLSRKIIHSGSAPLFMCLWPLFSTSLNSRYFAAGVVGLQMTRLIVAGTLKSKKSASEPSTGITASSQELVNAISRSGESKEALGGPLIYTIVLLISTALWFRESPIGVVAISQMAAGDGMADIVGRRWGTQKWPFAPNKSVVGSAAFVASAFLVTSGLFALYHATGFSSIDITHSWPTVLLISIACAIVELLPVEDNLSVPLCGAILAALLLR